MADFHDYNHATITYTDEHAGSVEVINGVDDVSMMEDVYFTHAVRGEKEPAATVAEGFEDLKLVSAVVASSEQNGETIKL